MSEDQQLHELNKNTSGWQWIWPKLIF